MLNDIDDDVFKSIDSVVYAQYLQKWWCMSIRYTVSRGWWWIDDIVDYDDVPDLGGDFGILKTCSVCQTDWWLDSN